MAIELYLPQNHMDLRLVRICNNMKDHALCNCKYMCCKKDTVEFHKRVLYGITNRSCNSPPSSAAADSPRFHITFNFSFKTQVDCVSVEDDDQETHTTTVVQAPVWSYTSAVAAVNQLSYREIRDCIEAKIVLLEAAERSWREDLFVFAWLGVCELFGFGMSSEHEHGPMPVPVPVVVEIDMEVHMDFYYFDFKKSGRGSLSWDSCSICLQDYSSAREELQVVMPLGCLHYFHRDCINRWLRKSRHCPCCRHEVPPNKWISARGGAHH